MIYKLEEPAKAAFLFEGWQESMIWSCLQGVMGEIYADDPENPKAAAAYLADFVFVAGEPSEELIMYDYGQNCILMVANDDRWDRMIQNCWSFRTEPITRYAIKKEPDVFDIEYLEKLKSAIPENMELRQIDEELYTWARGDKWAQDWVNAYPTYADYKKWGLGYCVLLNGVPISGASSYTSYDGGIEIQIDTRWEYCHQGLATICGAALILACLEKGWYPSWDAANMISVGLAEKLGYHFDHEYTAWVTRR